MGVNITTIVSYEDKDGFMPGADKLCALCEALGTNPTELMGFEREARWVGERRDVKEMVIREAAGIGIGLLLGTALVLVIDRLFF